MVKILAVINLGITFLKRTFITVLGTLDIYVCVKTLLKVAFKISVLTGLGTHTP
jgi:uncharacterized membrane protein YadS